MRERQGGLVALLFNFLKTSSSFFHILTTNITLQDTLARRFRETSN